MRLELRVTLGLATVVWSCALGAQPSLPGDSPLGVHRVLDVGLALGVVLAVLALGAWLVRRALRIRPGQHGELQLLGGLSLGARERLVLVQVGGRRVLLGVCPGRIQAVAVEPNPPASLVFADHLRARVEPQPPQVDADAD